MTDNTQTSQQEQTRTAILSVYDKTGLLDLAKGLIENNVRILASGGTARMIRDAGFPVDDVSTITHAPEMLGGESRLCIQLSTEVSLPETSLTMKRI